MLRSRSYVFSNLHDDFLVFSLFFHGKNRRAKWRIGFFLFCFYCVVKVFLWHSCSWRASGNRVSASCLQLVADNRSAKCAGNYRVAGSSPALPVLRQVTQPGRVCEHFLHPRWCDAPLADKCRRNYSFLRSWSRVRVPPLPLDGRVAQW